MLLPLVLFLASAVDAPLPAEPTTTAAPTPAKAKPRLIILNLSSQGVDAQIVTTISDSLAAGLSRTDSFDVVSAADITALGNLEATRQLTGTCDGKDSCMAEIASALGADLLVHGSVGVLGALTVVNVSLFDAKLNIALAREKVEAKRLENLARKLDVATARMLEAWEKKPLTPYPEINEDDGPSVPLLTAGGVVGVVGIVGVTVGGFMMSGAQGILENPSGDRAAKDTAGGNWDTGSYAVIGGGVAVVLGAVVVGIGFLGGL